jgi:signal transduction histidine kinase
MKIKSLSKDYKIFVNLVVISAIFISLVSLIFSYYNFKKEAEQKVKYEAEKLINKIDETLIYAENFVNWIGQSIAEKNSNDPQVITSLLERTRLKVDNKAYNIFTWTLFDFVNPQGMVIADSINGIIKKPLIVSVEKRLWMTSAKETPWKIQTSINDIGIISGEPIIPLGFGITGKNNNFLGYVSFGLNIQKFKDFLENQTTTSLTSFAVFGVKNDLILTSKSFDENNLKNLSDDLSGIANDSQNVKTLRVGEKDFFYKKSKNYPFLIVSNISEKNFKNELYKKFLPKILNTLYLTIFFLALLYFFRKKLVSPVVKLSEVANQVSQGNTAISVPTSEIEEINELSKSIELVRQFVEKQAEEKNSANQANHNKTEFLASTAHELKNIIAGIIGLTEAVKLNFSEKMESENKIFSAEEATENLNFLGDVVKLGEELSEFIHDILDVNQAQTGDFKIEEHSLVDVKETILRSVKLLKTRAIRSKKNIVPTFLKQVEEDFIVNNLDPRRLKQVIVNLISNSIKYAADNSQIEVRLERLGETGLEGLRESMIENLQKNEEIDGERKAHLLKIIKKSRPKVLITIKDCGEGMSEDEIKSALQKYGRVKNEKHEFVDSTGLGLPLTKHLVELQGGMMIIYSKKGIGTEIKIFL